MVTTGQPSATQGGLRRTRKVGGNDREGPDHSQGVHLERFDMMSGAVNCE